MKHTSRILAAAIAAFTITSCSAATVNATQVRSFSQFQVVCKDGDCGNINDILKQYCGKNCNISDILNSGGYCPDGNCSVNKPSQPASKTAKSDLTVKKTANTAKTDNTEFNTAYETEVLRLVNEERANCFSYSFNL